MQDNYSIIHSFLGEIMSVSSNEKLDEITSRYRAELADAGDSGKELLEDIVTIGKELIYLKTGSDD